MEFLLTISPLPRHINFYNYILLDVILLVKRQFFHVHFVATIGYILHINQKRATQKPQG